MTIRPLTTRPTNPWAVTAVVLSLFAWQGFVIAFISATLAHIALKQIKESGESGRSLAQFARAFAILLMIVMVCCDGYHDWPAYLSHYPLWPR